MKKNTVYMKVTDDEYELPVAISDDAFGLAEKVGVTANCIYSCISHAKQKGRKSQYVRVELEEEEKPTKEEVLEQRWEVEIYL